jgi:hypothetical protein
VGLGAVVHVSAAKHIQQLEVTCPPRVDREQWLPAVKGRILLLELARPDVDGAIWFVGLNQHVAAVPNLQDREILLSTIAHLALQIQNRGGRLIVLGDANAAPDRGRWGYSFHTKTRAADLLTQTWFSRTALREVLSVPLQATWRACLIPRKATLDRAWVYPPDLSDSDLSVQWTTSQPVFDHALITLRLSHTVAGMGFAGASHPPHPSALLPRCRVNLKKLREPAILAEWTRLLHLSLTAESPLNLYSPAKTLEQEQPPDPFQALKYAELVADQIAQSLAPRRVRRPGEFCRSFCFGGHRAIFREMHLIRNARAFVFTILQKCKDVLGCPRAGTIRSPD